MLSTGSSTPTCWRTPALAPLSYQVTSACDAVKAGARLAGLTPPRHDDTETTFPEPRARIAKTFSFIEGVAANDYAGEAERKITPPWTSSKFIRPKTRIRRSEHKRLLPLQNYRIYPLEPRVLYREYGLNWRNQLRESMTGRSGTRI
ncbi:DUF1993 family protein [Methylobacterium nigriterrae]|uniref:DUF1993 family protein n=1 Tax=Methylobacterium nigriterrae TaxID=3127512 RepID=UPI003D66F5CD